MKNKNYYIWDSFSTIFKNMALRSLVVYAILAHYITRQYTCNWIAPDVRFVYCVRTVVLGPFILAKDLNQKVFVVVLKPYNTAFFNINFCFNYLDFSPCVFLCSMCYSMLHVFFYAPCVILCSMCYSMIHVLFYAIEAGIFNGYIHVLKCANICNLNHFLKIIFLSYCLFLRLLGYF